MIFDIRRFLEQPVPLVTQHCYVPGGTVIVRAWAPEDVGRCTRCPECCASDLEHGLSMCTLWTARRVAPEDAAEFAIPADGPRSPRTRVN